VRGGLVTIEASMSGDGETHIAAVDVDGSPLATEAPVVIDTATLPDGLHTVTMHVEDTSRQRNSAKASASFRSETQWWAGDITAPAITVTVPVTVVSGIATIGVATSDAGEHGVTLFSLDGASLPFTGTVSVDTRTLSDGEHTVVVEAQDASRQRNRAVARVTFLSDNAPPKLAVRLDPPTATQGHSQVIRVSVNEPVRAITATLGSRALALVPGGNEYWTVVGYAADAKPGRSVLTVRATDYPGMISEITATSAITIFSFPVESVVGEDIELPPDRVGLLNYGITETAYLDTIYAPVTPEPLWHGQFAVPVAGRQTSPFAIRRSYNGGPLGSFHGGLDIAADAGVRVPAANRGRVVLAELLHVRGNTVILDHGMGVYTAYCHLSQIDVRKGQIVDKGQVVGLVGDTGVSTGPHLHWEMRVTGNAVDPWPWTQSAIP
jgi:murein DD-endopeptidase MepM/ murein hydrolase activator NlpD